MASFSCPYCGAILVVVSPVELSCPDCGGFSITFTMGQNGFSVDTPGYEAREIVYYGEPVPLSLERTPVPRAFTDAFGEEDLTP